MRLPRSRSHELPQLEVKMTPMIDVIFLLLTFFIATSSFRAPEEALPTHLLASGAGAVAPPVEPELEELEEVVVRLLWSGDAVSWEINRRPLARLAEVAAVLEPLARVQSNLPVVIDAAGEAPLTHVIDVYDLCRRLGFERIHFAAHRAA